MNIIGYSASWCRTSWAQFKITYRSAMMTGRAGTLETA